MRSSSLLWLLVLHLLSRTEGECKQLEVAQSQTAVRNISPQTALVRVPLRGVDLTTDLLLSSLHVRTHPPLQQDTDFVLHSFARDNALPEQFRGTWAQLVGLRLLPGRRWGEAQSTLFVTAVFLCSPDSAPTALPIDQRTNDSWVAIAHIRQPRGGCPSLPPLPGASAALTALLHKTLTECQAPRIMRAHRLDWRKVSSLRLLSLQPPVLLVDATARSLPLEQAAAAVDAFLAAHAVLEVAWEPRDESEPRWWVLVPRPAGMPGHLFAMLDAVQWTHPVVANAAALRAAPLCNSSLPGCVPGCPLTRIKGITGSGWGADTGHLVGALQQFFMHGEPMQAGPFKLGRRVTPPLWGGTIGWLYTYTGCPSNFLDCYFLEHSPCPRINMDTWNEPGVSAFDRQRFEPTVNNPQWGNLPAWWHKTMGPVSSRQPEYTIGDIFATPSTQTFYTYLLRPNYALRTKVHQRVDTFGLSDRCAVMHVRRGDSIMHGGQARAYLRIVTYLRAARPLMDALGVRTVLLVTDSHGAVEEAEQCARDHPADCGGISFRYLPKKRWVGAEGGWENPFPSGDSRVEMLDIQLEFALAQHCVMAITGESNYAEKIMHHMCCGFPLAPRGVLPQRCVCPPRVRLRQGGFDCKSGNVMHCDESKNLGGDITKPLDDPSNMYAANLSLKATAFIHTTKVCFSMNSGEVCYTSTDSAASIDRTVSSFITFTKKSICANIAASADTTQYSFC